MVAEETIMICIDNSEWMGQHAYSYEFQLKCARWYCRAKHKLNPKNDIGVMITGTKHWVETLRPTSDINKVVRYLKNLSSSGLGGELGIGRGIIISRKILNNVEPCKLKRILFFARGPGDMCYKKIQVAEEYGNLLKKEGIAVDFITFCRNENRGCDWKMVLDAFVAAANNNNNSHIKHVRPGSYTRVSHVLSSTPEIIPFALLEEKDDKKAKDERKNQNDDENVSKTERGMGRRRRGLLDHPLELDNRSKALSPNNDMVKKMKMLPL